MHANTIDCVYASNTGNVYANITGYLYARITSCVHANNADNHIFVMVARIIGALQYFFKKKS